MPQGLFACCRLEPIPYIVGFVKRRAYTDPFEIVRKTDGSAANELL